jgi:hypothetical protein
MPMRADVDLRGKSFLHPRRGTGAGARRKPGRRPRRRATPCPRNCNARGPCSFRWREDSCGVGGRISASPAFLGRLALRQKIRESSLGRAVAG